MLVRAYQPVGAPVRIVVPNERLRLPDESDADFLARICAVTEAHDPTLAGLPVADVAPAALPARQRTVGDTVEDVRAAWRVKNGAVVRDPAVVVPTRPRTLDAGRERTSSGGAP